MLKLAIGARFGFVICLVIVLSRQTLARFWRRPKLPSNPNDPYYQVFQTIPPANITAKKLMNNFLHINSKTFSKRAEPEFEDMVIVLDGSGSVGSCEFKNGKKALKYMIKELQAPGYDTKYAAVTYSTSANVNFKFLSYSTAASRITHIRYTSGSTNTQAGLEEAKKLFLDSTSGRRVYAKRIVFLLTDGHSNVQKPFTILKAKNLRNIGALIYVVVVGDYIHGIDEMVKIASFPPQEYIYRVKKFKDFYNVVLLALNEVSPGKYKIVAHNDPPC